MARSTRSNYTVVPTKAQPRIPQPEPAGPEGLPAHAFEVALNVVRVIRDVFRDRPARWERIAAAMGSQPPEHYQPLLSSALDYNLLDREDDEFALSDTARRILQPTTEADAKRALLEAITAPPLFHDFFREFQGKPFPPDEQLMPLLIRYGIDRKYLADVSTRLRENGIYANVLQQQSGAWRIAGDQLLLVFASEVTTGPDNAAADIDYDKVIFVITPIGQEGSEERKHADLVLRQVIAPVAKALELNAVRADEIERSGIINRQVFEFLTRARISVADLSFNNPNAFYELGVRHMSKLPTIQIIREGDSVPFDVSQNRTIRINTKDVYAVFDSVEAAKEKLLTQITAVLAHSPSRDNSPVDVYLPGVEVRIPIKKKGMP